MASRFEFVDKAQSYIGCNESDGSHKKIIDLYNSFTPRARGYKMQYNDAWCATFVSACAIAIGATDIVPLECSCYYMVQGAKSKGIWVENDAYIPTAGDIIMYDWQDSGNGDNTGSPDHVGIVEACAGGKITVIEGNYSNAVKRRVLNVNGKYIRGFIVPKFTDVVTPAPVEKPVETVDNSTVKEVRATAYAQAFDKSIAGAYITTTALHCRNGAGTGNKSLVVIPKGCIVQNYGYYSMNGGTKWFYIQFTLNKVKYTGFSSSKYLRKK